MTYNMQTQSMGDKYQQVIDMIYHDCPNPPEGLMMTSWVDGAYFLACAIKECMTHKDLGWVDTGYIYEKISRALRSLGMKEVKA